MDDKKEWKTKLKRKVMEERSEKASRNEKEENGD